MLVQVYVDDIIFGSTKQSMYTEFEECMHKRFQMSSMGELTFFLGLQVKQQPDGIFISQDKYVADILKKFDFWSIRTATTPIESNKPLVKDEDGVDVDVHIYRSMIGSLMYLTASRPDIMFAVCACARDSPFELEAFSDSDYGGASLDRKSTTGGCQFLGRRLISWQCKKQTIVANSTTEAKYVAAANCCGQVLWIQNQMMDYGFNFMNTKIHIDNESTISVIKNPVSHSRTKHIEIRFHFIRDCYEKRLIKIIKIHTDHNVADLLTKGFDVSRFNFLVVSIGMMNLSSMDLRMDESCAVKQLWQTATIRTLANGTQELVASIDNKEYTITEASVRSKFQSADAAGISNLPDAEIYDGLATLGGYAGEHVHLLPAMLAGAAEDQGEGSAIPVDPHHTSVDPVPSTSQPQIPSINKPLQQPSPPRQLDRQDTEIPQSQDPTFTNVADKATTMGVRVGTKGATTTTSGLDAGLDSGNMHESPLRSHEVPLHEGHTSGSAEDRLKLKDLIDIVPKLVTRIDDLEKELHQTKHTYGKVILTLVDRVKSLEKTLKRKTKKVVISDSEDEEPEDQERIIQDIDDDPLVSLVRESMKEKDTDFMTPTNVSALGEAQELGEVKNQREGKAPMTTEEIQATKRIKAQIQQEKASLAEAMRLKALQEEEAARQVHLDALLAKRISKEEELSEQQKKRKAEVQEAAQHYTKEDWDTIRAKLEANAELTKSLQGESTSEDFAKKMGYQRDYMSTFIKNQSSWKLTQLKKLTFEELKIEFEKLVKSIENFVPMETEERIKRQGVQLEQEFSKKQKTIEEVPVLEESATEPVIVKEEEIEKPVKKRGKIKKQKARKGIHVDKTAQDESQKAVYQIIRANGADKVYMSFGAILKDFSRDDLTKLYRLVIKKYGANRPEEAYDRVLWGDLKTMFDPPLSEDMIWSLPLQQKMVNWRYYDSCVVHCLTLEACTIYMLADRKYPLSKDACQAMLNMKLQGGAKDEVCYQLLKMIEKQAGIRWSGL
ncbi:putative ribonuclease H-like domain-containing protein [Tanacetum coccineum]